jgi:hypothetical protein
MYGRYFSTAADVQSSGCYALKFKLADFIAISKSNGNAGNGAV